MAHVHLEPHGLCVSLFRNLIRNIWNVAHVHLEPHGLYVSLFRNLIRNGMWPTSIWNLMVCVCLSLGTSSAMECGPRPSGTSWSVCVSSPFSWSVTGSGQSLLHRDFGPLAKCVVCTKVCHPCSYCYLCFHRGEFDGRALVYVCTGP